MKHILSDTHPDAEAVLLRLYRETPAWRKWQLVMQHNELMQGLMTQGLKQRDPGASDENIKQWLLEMILGKELTDKLYLAAPDHIGGPRLNEITFALKEFADALDQLSIPYFIGGSLASSIHGANRSTFDADVVVDLKTEHVEPLAAMLGSAYYADPNMMRDAIRRRSSFNLIHYPTSLKIDVFIPQDRAFNQRQFERRVKEAVNPQDDDKVEMYIASPEDIILAKLEWYRKGNEVSDRQWIDLMSVVKTQQQRLDIDYMKQMAAEIGIADLLERALAE
jgi:hypothetical protein